MASVRDIRTALAEAYKVQLGISNVYDYIPEQADPPFIAVSWPDRVVWSDTLSGGMQVDIVVSVGLGLADFKQAQHDLDELLDPAFVYKIATTTSPAWYDLAVISAENIRQVNVGAQVLVVDFVHEIRAE